MSDSDPTRIEAQSRGVKADDPRAHAYPLPEPPLLGRRAAGICSVVLVVAVLLPIAQNWRDPPIDRFPLSYYPMFTLDRPDVIRVDYLVGIDEAGAARKLDYRLIASGGFNQARRQIRKTLRQDRAQKFCAGVAKAVADDRRYDDIRVVQIVTGRFRVADYFTGNKAPVEEELHASATVKRGDS